jgi:hypothetical protein
MVAAIALCFPLWGAPAIFNLAALSAHLAPLGVLLSTRASTLATLPVRMFLGLAYVCLPNSFEIHMNLTNAQWHLALLLFLVLILPTPQSLSWRAFDWAVILAGGLSGPFSLLLAPLAWLLRWKNRAGLPRATAVSVCAAVQLATLLFLGGRVRQNGPSGASVEAFSRVVGGQVVVGSLLGQRTVASLNQHPDAGRPVFFGLTLGALAGAFLVGLRGSFEHKVFLAFAALIVASALQASTGNATTPAWWSLGDAGIGGRYWLIPMLACLVTLVWLSGPRHHFAIRATAIALLASFPIGVVLDWRYRPFEDFHWRDHAAMVERSAPGSSVRIPINPPGWAITLKAQADRR